MHIRPKVWSYHHTQRLYHLSMLAAFGFIIAVIIFGIFAVLLEANADQLAFPPQSLTVSAVVPGISGEPAVVDSIGYGQPPLLVINNPLPLPQNLQPPQTPQTPPANKGNYTFTITPPPEAVSREVTLSNGHLGFLPTFDTQNPLFSGTTNIKNALIYLEVHSYEYIRGTTYVDQSGNWSWQVPEPVSPGEHTLYAAALDPKQQQVVATAQLEFFIASTARAKNSGAEASLLNLPEGASLLDVLVRIPDQFKKIAPGDDVVASIQLINFGSSGNAVDVPVQYTIEDQDGNIIAQSSETVAVATRLSLIKTFHTNANLPSGTYKLTVRVPSKGVIATSADTYEIQGTPVLALGTYGKVDFTLAFQTLLVLLFIFSLVLYFEYNKVSVLSGIIKKVDEQDFRIYNNQ